jgi:6-phosphogluconolactonase (cycloisomerase 2 family)
MTTYAYVGCRTTRERNARGEGIGVFQVGADSALTLVQRVSGLVNPSYLALNREGTRLYTVHGDQSEASAFAVDRATGRLSLLNTQSTEGKNPVHLALDAEERYLVVTNHLGASLAVLPIGEDGGLLPLSQLVKVDGPIGPHRVEQKQVKPHFNAFDPSGRYVLVPDKGCDRTWSFTFQDGRLTPCEPAYVQAREGAGPRHMAFHPRGAWAYVVNELDSTVTAYRFDAATGALSPFQWLPTLPFDFTGDSRCAAIAIDASGRRLYASNRGHDSIAVFAIDPESGHLSFVEATPTGGRTPRAFTLSPDGTLLYALNEDSDSIVTFAVDTVSGRLTPTGQTIATGSPVCLVFAPA